jgi:Protein of unknown function (DUF3016)
MKTTVQAICTTALTLACTALFVSAATAKTTVNFVKSEDFVDMPTAVWEKARVMESLQTHLTKLGEKLPAGQDLTIDILDIDLAGRQEPYYHGRPDVRVMRGGADWPMIQLRYKIEENSKVIREGEERLADLNYQNQFQGIKNNDALKYEKRLLDGWFKGLSK